MTDSVRRPARARADDAPVDGEPPSTPSGVRRAFRDSRPPADGGLARKAGLSGVLGKVMGERAPRVRLGRYELGDTASKGSMGAVYRATNLETGAGVAVKILHAADRRIEARFAREAEALRAIVHPNVVRFVDHGVDAEGAPYLVMDWLEGNDLCSVLRARRLSVHEAVMAGIAGARGLEAAHARGVFHRDVKPSNLFVLADPVRAAEDVRVIDFGLAGVLEGHSELTAKSAYVGTPQFMAPEQIDGDVDLRADIYGLGATLYAALTGEPPFRGRSPLAVALAVTRVPAPDLRERRPDVADTLAELIAGMMAKRADDRPQTMAEVAAVLSAHA